MGIPLGGYDDMYGTAQEYPESIPWGCPSINEPGFAPLGPAPIDKDCNWRKRALEIFKEALSHLRQYDSLLVTESTLEDAIEEFEGG